MTRSNDERRRFQDSELHKDPYKSEKDRDIAQFSSDHSIYGEALTSLYKMLHKWGIQDIAGSSQKLEELEFASLHVS